MYASLFSLLFVVSSILAYPLFFQVSYAEKPNTICGVHSPGRSANANNNNNNNNNTSSTTTSTQTAETRISSSSSLVSVRNFSTWEWQDNELRWRDLAGDSLSVETQHCHTNRTVRLFS
jgi:hypothetical protein